MDDKLLLTLDCSTTSSKCIIWNAKGESVSESRHEIPLSIPEQGWGEQDPADWWDASKKSIIEATKAIDSSKVVAIAITHQRESFVCLDENDLPLRPAMLWLDTRAKEEVREFGNESVVQITGKPANPTPAFYKLHWIKKHQPEIFQKIKTVSDVHSYLVNKLAGEFITPVASADPLGLIDLDGQDYSQELLESLGLDASQLPALAFSGEQIAELSADAASELGLSSGVKIIAGGGDGQCAGLGAAVTKPGSAYLNLGTGIIAGLFSSDYKQNNAYRAMAGTIPNSYNYELFIGAGTYMVNWFLDNFASSHSYPEGQSAQEYWQQKAAEISIGCDGLYAVPYWNGALTPYWDQDARGILVGFSGVHNASHVYRAIFEGIAYELRVCFDLAAKTLAEPVTEIIAMGGGTKSELWSQMIADVLEIPLVISKEEEATSLGAAMLAAYGAGLYESIEQAATEMSNRGKRYEPNPATHDVYQQHQSVYKEFYPALKSTFSKMAGN